LYNRGDLVVADGTHCSFRHRPGLIAKRKVAIKILQGLARCILARRRILRRADVIYRRVYDADSGVYYYANIYTGSTSWTKSTIYLHASSEPPIMQDGEVSASSGSARGSAAVEATAARRSPRYNRAA
jgi:hypothetical protein